MGHEGTVCHPVLHRMSGATVAEAQSTDKKDTRQRNEETKSRG